MAVFLSRSEEETLRWAREYAKTLSAGDVVLLDGEMGAGKTVIAKGIAEGLGVTCEVTSPTYAYVNDYGGVYHFDCYRVPSEEFAERLGFSEYFEMGGVCLVEWAEHIAGLIPARAKKVTVKKRGETLREIRF